MEGYPATATLSASARIEDILDQIEEYDAWFDSWESTRSEDEAD
jgi:hypothetical protein